MKLNVSIKIVYSEMIIAALILTTLVPYLLASMNFTPLQLFHYINITLFILTPVGIGSLFYFTDRWECRPIEMLSFYRERRLVPPDDIESAARVRALNLPLVHSLFILVRYETICLLTCLYMGVVAGLPLRENLRLGITACIGISFYPIYSFFLTERFLAPVRRILAENTGTADIDETGVIKIGIRTRLVSVLLATVMGPLIALGALIYRRMDTDLSTRLGDPTLVGSMAGQMFDLISLVSLAALILAAGVGILLATSISNPLGHLVDVIRQLERGNLRARTSLVSNDELGVLSRSFDSMAIQLEKNHDERVDLNRTLELRVAEKTENLRRAYERHELSNRKLAVANQELEEANRKLKEIDRMKTDFISIVSHELRTPLTSIKAFTEIILMKPDMPVEKREKLLHIINNETDRLARLITDILDITKIEAGKMSWRITSVSLSDIIQTSVAGVQSIAENKKLLMTVDVPDSLPSLQGDRDRLIQVITNILSNAIKFTLEHGKIGITARQELFPEDRIIVSISDTGIGIPPGETELIFEKFRRSGDVLTNSSPGTGLGLAITRQIVEYHGGAIRAESRLGEGSTFTFTLPLGKQWTGGNEQTVLESF